MKKFNEQQVEAINHFDGPCVVLAVPGSGKTSVIVERVIHLCNNKNVDPKNILCLTFTNKASKEMKDRISLRLGEKSKKIYIGTFHSLCLNILRNFADKINYNKNISIYDESDQFDLISKISRQFNQDFNSSKLKSLCYSINNHRENLLSIDEITKKFDIPIFANITEEYMKTLKLNNAVDFSGILYDTYNLLKSHNEVLSKLQNRFKYIIVDETQDTNYAQFQIVNLLGDSHKNVFIVGDHNQSIYSWRGARYKNIKDFILNHNSKVINLPLNYRSTPQITGIAENLIKCNSDQDKNFKIQSTSSSGDPVYFKQFLSPEHEAYYISKYIENIINNKEYKPEDIAILYRINSLSRSIENALIQNGIPYNVIGGFSFYDRTEIKDIISMLRFFNNKNDSISFSRFINRPNRKFGNVTVGAIENYSKNNNVNVIDSLKDIEKYISRNIKLLKSNADDIIDIFSKNMENENIGNIIEYLVDKLNYKKYLSDNFDENSFQERIQNIDELINSAQIFSENNNNNLNLYLNNISLSSPSDKESKENCVSLMTIHASKGLEFPVVFMVGLNDGILPFEKSVMEREDGLEEERRLCYVGMTRAKNRLFISFPSTRPVRDRYKNMVNKKCYPSRFLFESNLIKKEEEDE